MNNYRISYRYANALLELAIEQNMLEQVYHDIDMMCEVFRESRDLRLLLKSPVISSEKKLGILDTVFGKNIEVLTWKFIEILVKKRRDDHLAGIMEAFIEIYRKSKNIHVVKVTTAVPLDDYLRNRLLTVLKQETGAAEIVLNEKVDAKVIGGLVVKTEDRMFDNSIKKKVQSLRLEFSDESYKVGF